jgi:hypothetical protein
MQGLLYPCVFYYVIIKFYMKKKILIVSMLVVSLILTGCSFQKKSTNQDVVPSTSESSDSTVMDDSKNMDIDLEDDAHIVALAGSRVSISNVNSFKAGQNTIAFKLFGLDGHEFGDADLRTVHDKKLHLIVVRDDMQGFMHLHPEYKDSKWSVETEFNLAGKYNMYLDFDAFEEEPTVLRVPFKVDSETYAEDFPGLSADMKAEVDGYMATLKLDTPPKTNEDAKLNYVITKNGKPVENIKPYLGAYGHVVMFRQTDVDDYFHVHPIEGLVPSNGTVEFETVFPLKGRYTIFGQFNLDGSTVVFPITLDVTEEGKTTEGSMH